VQIAHSTYAIREREGRGEWSIIIRKKKETSGLLIETRNGTIDYTEKKGKKEREGAQPLSSPVKKGRFMTLIFASDLKRY